MKIRDTLTTSQKNNYFDDANAALVSLCRTVLEDGITRSPRGIKTLELINHTTIFPLSIPLMVIRKSRNLKPSYIARELEWYCSKNRNVDFISKGASFWNKLADEYNEVVSNYGYWIYEDRILQDNTTYSQLDILVKTLSDDPDSRQGILNIHGIENRFINPKDVPCTINLQFMIIDNRLDMIVNMRSNDLFKGWCNDIVQFQFIAWYVYTKLRVKLPNLKLGRYFHNAASLHVYESDFSLCETISNECIYTSREEIIAEDFEIFRRLHVFINHLETGRFPNVDSLNSARWSNIIQYYMFNPESVDEPKPVDDFLETANILNDEGV